MKTRFISSIAGIIVIVVAYLLSNTYFILLGGLLSLIMNHEYANALKNKAYKPMEYSIYIWTIVYFSILMFYYKGVINTQITAINTIVFAFFLVNILSLTIIMLNRKYSFSDYLYSMFGCIYINVLVSFLVFIKNLPMGGWLLGYVLLGAFSTDIFSYLIGSKFGKRKIIEHISPKKTLAGFYGGFIGSAVTLIILTVIASSVSEFNLEIYKVAIIAVFSGLISQLGDWTASCIKRHVGIKDFGSLMPGHGGALDRLDSVIFLAPFMYFIFIM